jgi:hypothetical protein
MIKNIYINQRFIDPSVLLRYPLITKYSISDVSTIEGADIVGRYYDMGLLQK